MEQIKKATKTPECFFICVMVYMELIFQCLRFGVNKNAIYKILFAIFYGLVFGSLVSLLQGLGRKIVTGVLLSLVTIYFIAQVIYFDCVGHMVEKMADIATSSDMAVWMSACGFHYAVFGGTLLFEVR